VLGSETMLTNSTQNTIKEVQYFEKNNYNRIECTNGQTPALEQLL
jgi:hypothetical protein